MRRRLGQAMFAATISMMALASPVLAHGDHEAQALARHLVAGPFTISLWQIYSDAGVTMTPHLIVMFDDRAPAARETAVAVSVNAKQLDARPSITTANGWETTEGVVEKDVVAVTISDGSRAWQFDPVVVPPPPTSGLPMKELVLVCILLTVRSAWWVGGRTARAWRKPVTIRVEESAAA